MLVISTVFPLISVSLSPIFNSFAGIHSPLIKKGCSEVTFRVPAETRDKTNRNNIIINIVFVISFSNFLEKY